VGTGVLNAGKNVLAVRVMGRGDKRGFQEASEGVSLKLSNGQQVALGKGWRVRVVSEISDQTPGPKSFDQFPNIPTMLFNGMLSPHLVQGIRGAIWYQGESNAPRAWQYRTLLPAMIAAWRRAFGQGDFPFYLVGLAAYTGHQSQPDDAWAELREAQALAASTVPKSGLAVAIDVGDANDIHPKNKKPVGERLALVALAKEYGKDVVSSGPVYHEMKTEGSALRLSFHHTEGGLKVQGEKLGEFLIAGADQRWHGAEATLEDNEILVSSPNVPRPVAVRYAWRNNPVATLFNGAGLPAVPFRTDDWPATTRQP
jgi:sialate O-acetylesterase